MQDAWKTDVHVASEFAIEPREVIHELRIAEQLGLPIRLTVEQVTTLLRLTLPTGEIRVQPMYPPGIKARRRT